VSASRIVSLLPSTTEIACALGFREALVGRSHECDFPPGVEALPVCTEPKLDPEATSRAIDDAVKRFVRDGLSIYRVDPEQLRTLAPDVILTQDQCEVCAASLADVEAAVREWVGGAPQVVSLSPETLGDVWGDLERMATALGAPERGRALAETLTERVTEIGERAAGLGSHPRVALVEWIDPLMGAGNWMPELVSLAGGTPLFGKPGAHSPWLAWQELRDADPDVVVILPCGFDRERSRRELPPLLAQPGWDALTAVKAGRVYLADGNQYFNRPGPRLVESLEILAEVLHPDAFAFGHEGSGWERL
jgi:iron complex transport system substrate-binding protein